MKIIVAPDKFKGCLSATEVAKAIAIGIAAAAPDAQIVQCPMADGGEGTVDAILKARGGRLITRRVTGPLPEMKVDASFALLSDGTTAVIEMSAASGLSLLKLEDRNPLNTTTFGTGELIAAAVNEGAKKIIVGLGGSATIDAGIGCAQACGFTILMKDGQPTSLTEPLCGRDLNDVLMVKNGRGEITNGVEIVAAADVTNSLLGEKGAPRIFGKQKGATEGVIDQFDDALWNLSQRTGTTPQARQIGSGAAGGLGFGILAFMRGRLVNGFDLVSETTDFQRQLSGADLCITGEGSLDPQTRDGKTVAGVAGLCKGLGIPCIAVVGTSECAAGFMSGEGLTGFFSICNRPMSLQEALHDVATLLCETAHNCMSLWLVAAGVALE